VKRQPINLPKSKETYKDRFKHTERYDSYIKKSLDNTYNILSGSIRSSKSTMNTLAFIYNMLKSPDNLHMICATTSIVAKSVFVDGNGLGLKHFFEGYAKETLYSGHQALKISIPGRDDIILLLMGMQNKGSYKNFRGMSIGMILATETTLFDEESFIEALNRTGASRRRRIFMDYNEDSPYHRIYSDDCIYSTERLIKTIPEQVNFMKVTLQDNPAMTEEMKESLISMYPKDSIPYRRFILAERVVAESLIYTVNDYNIINEFNPADYPQYVVVADPGIESSATVFILLALKNGANEVHVLKEYYHRNADNKLKKMPGEYAEDFVTFIEESNAMMGRMPNMIYTDLDLVFQRELRVSLGNRRLGYLAFKDAIKEKIEDRINMGISWLYKGTLRIYKECKKTIHSFQQAQWDSKKSVQGLYERLDNPQQGTMIDCLDATEYGMTHFNKLIYRR